MTDITVLGDINVDLITNQISKFPRKDRQTSVDAISISPGGSSFNVALAASSLGLKTRFIGKLGSDIFSQYLLGVANSFGLETKTKADPTSETGITLAINFKKGKRSFISYKGPNGTFSLEDFNPKDIEGKMLAISGFNLLDGLREDVKQIFDGARERGIMTALDPNWDPHGWPPKRLSQLRDVLSSTDIFFPDLDEARKISGRLRPQGMLKKLVSFGPKIVCLKLAKDGCIIGSGKEVIRVPAIEVRPISTVGAGDIFAASFLKSYLDGNPLYYCGRFATTMASISTTKSGLEKYPKGSDVECLLERTIGKDWRRSMTQS